MHEDYYDWQTGDKLGMSVPPIMTEHDWSRERRQTLTIYSFTADLRSTMEADAVVYKNEETSHVDLAVFEQLRKSQLFFDVKILVSASSKLECY